MELKLLRPLPDGRTFEQVKNHYLVEKAIAERLMSTDREGRSAIYLTMYDELFSKVPDHPRLTRRDSDALTRTANAQKLKMLRKYINSRSIMVEFAPGDCRFAEEMATHVQYVYGVDISDQRQPGVSRPKNLELVIYDGYNLPIENNSVDFVFSDQLIEHIHPDDTKHHFRIVNQILKVGGCYLFRTPHLYTGPHDVSRFFSVVPQGFHLKEWTYAEIFDLLSQLNYTNVYGIRRLKGINIHLPKIYFTTCELIFRRMSRKYMSALANRFTPNVFVAAYKL